MSSPIGTPEITDLSHFSIFVQPIVDDFMQSVIVDPVDYPTERRKQQIARRAVTEFETACSRAETILSTCSPHVTTDLRAVYTEAKDAFNLAAVTFNRANIRFDKRKQQFLRSSALNMGFLSPKALRRFEMWKEEAAAASPRVVEVAEVGFLGIVFLVFLMVMIGSWVSESGGKVGGSGVRLNGCVRGGSFDSGMRVRQGRAVGWELIGSDFGSLEGSMFNASNGEDERGICLKRASRGLGTRNLMGCCDLQSRRCEDGKNAGWSRDRCDSGRGKLGACLLKRGKTAMVRILHGVADHFMSYFKPFLFIEVAVPVDGSGKDERRGGREGYNNKVIGRVVLYRANMEQVRRVRDKLESFRVWGVGEYLVRMAPPMQSLLPFEWTGKR